MRGRQAAFALASVERRELVLLSAELAKHTAKTCETWCKKLTVPARVEWFDGVPNSVVPLENERRGANTPLATRIDAQSANDSACALYFDAGQLAVLVCWPA